MAYAVFLVFTVSVKGICVVLCIVVASVCEWVEYSFTSERVLLQPQVS